MGCICRGRPDRSQAMNKEIAAQLGISEKTVKANMSNIFNKLKVSRRLQLLLHQIVKRTE